LLEPKLGEPLLRFELRNSRSFFDDRTTIERLARENLSDASLFDDRVRLRSQAGSHEDVLDVAQPAQLSVQQVLTFTRAEEAPGDNDLAGAELRLELASANFEHNFRARRLYLNSRFRILCSELCGCLAFCVRRFGLPTCGCLFGNFCHDVPVGIN